jgi:murein DD-endopeptidase
MKALVLVLSLGMLSSYPPASDIRLDSRFAPQADRTDRGISVRYELHVVNRGRTIVGLHALHVRAATGGTLQLDIGDEQLRTALAPGQPGCDAVRGMLSPGGECVVFVDTDPMPEMPRLLRNTIEFAAGSAIGRTSLDLHVVGDTGPVLGPPLGTGTWVAVHYAAWPRGHRRVFYATARGEVLPGRFAIDFVRVSPNGSTSCRNPDRPADALGYGDPVLAVADGRIAAVRDGVVESPTISGNPAHNQATAPGNYVVLALDRGRFATYEHLRPGSIRVRSGDRVKRGAVLGELGFTGDSTGPHLHFHVSDSVAPLDGEGLPFTFDRFTLLGAYPDIARLGHASWQAVSAKEVRRTRPGANTVVSFAAAAPSDSGAGGVECGAPRSTPIKD